MRESIGGTWILGIVIVFIVLFTSYLALSVNYSKAFKVKNRIVNLIEENEGLSSETQKQINSYLNSVGYFVYGTCADTEDDIDFEGNKVVTGYEKHGSTNKYKYCVSTRTAGGGSVLEQKYYRVTVFFKFDIPILDSMFTFPVTGETKAVYFAKD